METHVNDSKRSTSQAAADRAADVLNWAIERHGRANFVVATGASQFDFIDALTAKESIDWSKTTMFHLDEYIGLAPDHEASFRKYLRERFLSKVSPGAVHLIHGDTEDPHEECRRLNDVIQERRIDVAFVGIGENGHIAFNDPPADFETRDPFVVVELDEECREQQVNEGWFESIDDVPERAITMSVHQIMAAESIICTVPNERKAPAVRECFGEGDITPSKPSSILKSHPRAHVYLDRDSASLLD
jgi:glucosamine-6-phosphate deaminase